MRKLLMLFSFLLFSISLFTGCAYQADMDLVRRELISLRDTTARENKDMDNRIKSVEDKLKELGNELKRKQADLEADQKNILTEVQSVKGLIEESEVKTKKLPTDLDEFKKNLTISIESLGDRLAELEKKIYASSGESTEKATPVIPPAPQNSQVNVPAPEVKTQPEVEEAKQENKPSEEDVYKEAYQNYLKGEFEKARQNFSKYLELYPNSKNAGNAQYWIGECFYSQKKYREAILAFFEVIKKYPKGNKVAAAYLKQGMSFMELGDKENAKNSFTKIITEYKNSDEAKIAAEKIAEIK
ncbi:MAG: tol-pal system protein YbgF [Candidatus Schekmanbacteria bacterium RBG_16_38_11]|uniref:Tol-pal system protein YbgF n=1 Tax=Candidatus Schekmanbacteria bacterium RBG_16_38_11 TaxID=1817880 RepID=A0A1F7RS04_9BACT|nr:MAG: tol-pal system protein YbgF [Candidatus Schekmanbacteria bacterium RBG_16_38_11]